MGKYILIIYGLGRSTIPMTKPFAVEAVNNWLKDKGWMWLKVKNIETDESVTFTEGEQTQITIEDIIV